MKTICKEVLENRSISGELMCWLLTAGSDLSWDRQLRFWAGSSETFWSFTPRTFLTNYVWRARQGQRWDQAKVLQGCGNLALRVQIKKT